MPVRYAIIRLVAAVLTAVFLCLQPLHPVAAAPLLSAPPLGERWFAILMGDEQTGFYRQLITALPEGGFQVEASGSVQMRVMGFSKEASSREVYRLGPNLALQTIEVEQSINGQHSRLTGKVVTDGLLLRQERQGKVRKRLLKFKGSLLAGPLLNLYPLLKGPLADTVYRVQIFDPEEVKIKPVEITVAGEQATPDGQPAIKLHNDLYPFVDNEIWVDHQGNTLLESVRDGLVVTRAEQPERLAALVSGMALAKKDLIYDFSLVRAEPPLKQLPAQVAGLTVAVDGYDPRLPLAGDGWQCSSRDGARLTIRTGVLRPAECGPAALLPTSAHLASVDGIEAASPAIVAMAQQVGAGKEAGPELAQALADWTAHYLEDTVDDSGSALAALEKKKGNCQSHAKLYTALARASGIATRFVSGLVSQDGKGFLYHSWAESWLDGRWVAVDPTFGQLPADPTHLALLEGHTPAELAPLVGMIGTIRVSVLEER